MEVKDDVANDPASSDELCEIVALPRLDGSLFDSADSGWTAETNGTNSISENNPSSGENGCKPDDNHVGVSGVFSGARAHDDFVKAGEFSAWNIKSGSDDMLYSDTLSGAHTLVNTVRVGGSNAGNSGASGARAQDDFVKAGEFSAGNIKSGSDDMLYSDTLSGAHTLVNTVKVGGSNAGNSGASGAQT
ncbi:uncharacterized protein A4U43_C06F12320 [Asparagus officinalis]|uniref:Uncharacterized protein n=1 Tax=Asparagus officinalis TaxID=4686 RepID=A0A5P1ERZ5_ASPOF|nr:uncharacterized protein A4U43_C06F12320 [Asparagus officinalis]